MKQSTIILAVLIFIINIQVNGKEKKSNLPYTEKCQLDSIAPCGIKHITLKWNKRAGSYRIWVDGWCYIYLHHTETDTIMNYVRGHKTIEEKKAYIKKFFESKGMKFVNNDVKVDDDNTRWWKIGGGMKGRTTSYVENLSYEDVAHPLYDIHKGGSTFLFNKADLTEFVLSKWNIDMCMVYNKPYNRESKYKPTMHVVIHFKGQSDKDLYITKLSGEGAAALGSVMLGEYSIFDKKVFLEYFLENLNVTNINETNSGWKLMSAKKQRQIDPTNITIVDVIDIIAPGYFSDDELEIWDGLPEPVKKGISKIALSIGGGPTNFEMLSPAQQAVIHESHNAK